MRIRVDHLAVGGGSRLDNLSVTGGTSGHWDTGVTESTVAGSVSRVETGVLGVVVRCGVC